MVAEAELASAQAAVAAAKSQRLQDCVWLLGLGRGENALEVVCDGEFRPAGVA
jgi:hypothetical protein